MNPRWNEEYTDEILDVSAGGEGGEKGKAALDGRWVV